MGLSQARGGVYLLMVFINGVPVDNFIINCYEDYMTSANWKEEFDEIYPSVKRHLKPCTCLLCEWEDPLKTFIQSLLDKQKAQYESEIQFLKEEAYGEELKKTV
jgi:hypothetical protein